ncbi:MAG: hypothetical protein FJ030_02220 [Chloroflexi bacterium]|nr:hypothetical protein [Chloroflexota bacterium]
MTIDQAIKLLEVVVSLIQTVTWPFLVLFILIYLGEPLKQFMSDLSRFNFKAGPTGLEASAERQAEAAALVGRGGGQQNRGRRNADRQGKSAGHRQRGQPGGAEVWPRACQFAHPVGGRCAIAQLLGA